MGEIGTDWVSPAHPITSQRGVLLALSQTEHLVCSNFRKEKENSRKNVRILSKKHTDTDESPKLPPPVHLDRRISPLLRLKANFDFDTALLIHYWLENVQRTAQKHHRNLHWMMNIVQTRFSRNLRLISIASVNTSPNTSFISHEGIN